jgi:hypothetical protein
MYSPAWDGFRNVSEYATASEGHNNLKGGLLMT